MIMKLIIKSKDNILDKQFLTHLFKFIPKIFFGMKEKRKLSSITDYLNKNIFKGVRRFTSYQITTIILKNIIFETDGKTAIIQIDPIAVFPYTAYKIKDIAALIDKGNLDIKGTHIFHNLFKYLENNIEKLRMSYEMGLF